MTQENSSTMIVPAEIIEDYKKGYLYTLLRKKVKDQENAHLVVTRLRPNNSSESSENKTDTAQEETNNQAQSSAAVKQSDYQEHYIMPPESANEPSEVQVNVSSNSEKETEMGVPSVENADKKESRSEATITLTPNKITEDSVNENKDETEGAKTKEEFVAPQEGTELLDLDLVNKQLSGTSNNSQDQSRPEPTQSISVIEENAMNEPKLQNNEQPLSSAQNDSALFDQLRESAKIATIVENSQAHVKLRENIEKLPVKQIKLTDLVNQQQSYMPIDHALLNVLGSVVIGKYLHIQLLFRDGTVLNLAPSEWLDKINDNQELIDQGFIYVYHDLNLEEFEKSVHSVSSYVIDTDDYVQYMLEFIPIVPVEE